MNFFVNSNQIRENKIYINNSDVNHIKNVLRKKPGDVINIVSEGNEYISQIISLTSECIECEVIDKKKENVNEPQITIFQGLAKADKIEYIIQKCTEIGVYEIIPVEMKRCVVKFDEKDKIKKIDRWKKIAEVAAKQSLRNDILKVEKILSVNQAIEIFKQYDYVIMAYEKEVNNTLKSVISDIEKKNLKIAVVIGPEGGIDEEEVEKLLNNGAISVSLGKRILRTETAPIVISSILMYEFSK
ncbi:MAG: 16S rRNA (uracil(1498)-N(3))-methyltransferase [Clostridia bacterium]|nr:16S rRNA (uracil(1498)-N(3))-methyltransferase [Clostridia bacterium]